MIVMLDLDGVLVDFCRGAYRFHGVEDKYPPNKWDFLEDIGLTAEEFWSPLGRKFWANLGWMPDGRKILSIAEFYVGTGNICFLSSPCQIDGCVDGKMDWCHRNLAPRYYRKIFLGSAKEMLAHKNAVLIDDSDVNIAEFKKYGGRGILVPRPWNERRKYSDVAPLVVEAEFQVIMG